MKNTPNNLIPLYVFLVAGLIFLCYANTFHVAWQFDDSPNITANYQLHINDLQPETLWKAFFARPFVEGGFYRPLANLSFALNWYFGQDNPLGYHIVNLAAHILTAIFLVQSTHLLLLRSPLLRKFTEEDAFFVAVLSTTLWAINPVQTQAVTYIVQRMASMAAMFFVFAVYNYIHSRQAQTVIQGAIRLFLCALFFLLALGCKENAVTLLPSLLLIEWLFFYKKNDLAAQKIITILISVNICLLLAALYYIVDNQLWQSLTTPVGSRPFSLGERLLTEPSILLFYLSLLLWPQPARLSIDHSFPLSTSLLQPWTTLPAILFIVVLLFFAVRQRRERPLLSFAILFFFINHLVESTFIPLELLFEHRNYLPSFFLFLPLAACLLYVINLCAKSYRFLHLVVVAMVPLLLMSIGLGTYSRNEVWATEESLWADAMNKAPDHARPLAKLAEIYGWDKDKNPGNLQTAVALLQKAMNQESPLASFKSAILDNIGKVYFNYGMIDQAITYYDQSLQFNPDFITSRYALAEALVLTGNFEKALAQINIVISKNDLQSRFFNLKTIILLWLDRPAEAADCCYQTLQRALVNKERHFYNIGVALSKAGHYKQGLWFLKRARSYRQNDIRIVYSLVENRLLAGAANEAKQYVGLILIERGLALLHDDIARLRTDYSAPPIDVDLIFPFILKSAQELVVEFERTGAKQITSEGSSAININP